MIKPEVVKSLIAKPNLNRQVVSEIQPRSSKILVVDDDDRIIDALVAILKRDGHQVLAAVDGQSALRMIEHERPDVSIIDVLLPGLDGIEVCRRAKSNPATQILMVILMTGYSARAKRLEGLHAGADDFLNKPIDPVELTARVRSLIRTKGLYDELEVHRLELEQHVAERTQELHAANERLEQLNQVKSNILAIVSHEFRTPLLKVKSGLWIALQEGINSAERQEAKRKAQEAIAQLEYRVEDVGILSFPLDIQPAPVLISDLVASALDQVTILRPGDKGSIKVDLADDLPAIKIDVVSLARALGHIIDNALKFSSDQPITIRGVRTDGHIELSVHDDGIGIADDLKAHLFEPLRQGNDTSTRRHGGMGIGLALVKMVLDAHGVPIEIESQPRVGTTVTIRFQSLASPDRRASITEITQADK